MAIARNTRELSLLYCIIQTESSCLSFQYTVTYNQSRDYLENNNPDVFYFLIQNWNDRLELFEPIQINDLQSLHDPQRYSYIACIHKHEACMSVIEGCDVLTFTFSMPLYSCQVCS